MTKNYQNSKMVKMQEVMERPERRRREGRRSVHFAFGRRSIFAILIIILVCRGYSFGFVTEGVKNPSNGWFLAKLMEKGIPHPP